VSPTPPTSSPGRPVPLDARRPLLATGLAAFLLGNGTGDLSFQANARGAVLEWGGPYALGIHLTGPWSVVYRVDGDGAGGPLPATSVERCPGGFTVRREGSGLRVEERATVHPTEPRILLHRRLTTDRPGPTSVGIALAFEPLLAPVLMEGIRPLQVQFGAQGPTLRATSSAFSLTYDAEPLACRVFRDGVPWIGGRVDGRIRQLRIEHDLVIPPGGAAELRSVVSGGRRDRHPFGPIPSEIDGWADAARRPVEAWIARSPTLEVPESPGLVRGYENARAALRELYTLPEPGFQGLVAGYPWYSSLWCRDIARMAPALLWMGDAPWLAGTLDTVFRFQAPRDLPIVGAHAGELPMQLSPGPIFLYGTSDTSLYYPDLVRRYIGHTGDLEGARRWFPGVAAVRRWGAAKLSAGSGLFRNGGEIEGVHEAVASASRVQLGIDSPDTTIWDSADRRDHAVDLQLLWLQMLRALAWLSEAPGAPREWRDAGVEADRFGSGLTGRYRWPEESYLFDSIRADGQPVRQIRPNALQWVGEGLLDPASEQAVVQRALREDLATAWGLRTLSATDADFDPQAYHMGQVWTITSAWAARAALRTPATRVGAAILERMATQYEAEGGYAHECYRGDRPEPYDSCFLLGFSVAPFLSTLFEGLLGLALDAPKGVLRIEPAAPFPYERVRLRGLAFGAGVVDLEFRADAVIVHWNGPDPLTAAGRGCSIQIAPGASGTLELPSVGQRS
jgi:hypothetical protein